jgi:hypothetical protein
VTISRHAQPDYPKEVYYGGFLPKVVRSNVGAVDGRSDHELASWSVANSDCMMHHGADLAYSQTVDPIVTRWQSAKSFLSPRFLYRIEDCPRMLKPINPKPTGYESRALGVTTVLVAACELVEPA